MALGSRCRFEPFDVKATGVFTESTTTLTFQLRTRINEVTGERERPYTIGPTVWFGDGVRQYAFSEAIRRHAWGQLNDLFNASSSGC